MDDLKIKVYADGAEIEQIVIMNNDALEKVYTLSNGLNVTFGAGDLVKDEEFVVNAQLLTTSFTPNAPGWGGSTADPMITGTYNGTNGTGSLTFRVDREGTHGTAYLKIKAYAPDGSFIEDINIDKEDPINTTYLLSSGLTFLLGAGDLINNETFSVDVVASTSFSTTPHAVESTAEVTLGGVYDGSQGTGELTFYVTQGGEHGSEDISVEVRESDGTVIETVSLLQTDPTDTVYSLSNGLTFQLGVGTVTQDESFSISVNDQIGTRVDPDKQFDGVRNNDAQFDIGFAITAGAFEVNGVAIDVYANDILNTVLDRITQSAADVTAVFAAATETVKLTRNTVGAGNSIVFANDTSGFVAAAKLGGAAAINAGNTTSTAIGDTDALWTVSSGAFEVNGVSISIDVAIDSFEDVVERINTSGAQVTATYDEVTHQLTFSSLEADADFELLSGDTGLFEAISISSGTYEPTEGRTRSRGLGQQSRREMTRLMSNVSTALNKLFDDSSLSAEPDEFLKSLRSDLRQGIAQSFDSDGLRFETEFGVNFNFEEEANAVFQFAERETEELVSNLKPRRAITDTLFQSHGKQDGLIHRLLDATTHVEKDLSLRMLLNGQATDFLA